MQLIFSIAMGVLVIWLAYTIIRLLDELHNIDEQDDGEW
jgi:NhaP-type Na+/H+ or K+/H+ antiporter